MCVSYLLTGHLGAWVLIVATLRLVWAGNEETKYDRNYLPVGLDPLSVTFRCKKGYRLADVNVMTGKNLFNGLCDLDVYGMPTSLIASVVNCHWKRSCTISLPVSLMINCYSLESRDNTSVFTQIMAYHVCNCILERPEFLRPVRAVCVKNKDIKNVLHKRRGYNADCKKGMGRSSARGIIRSHDNIPWFYSQHPQKKLYRFKIRLRHNCLLIVAVKMIDICHEDSLKIRTKRTTKLITLTAQDALRQYNFTPEDKFVEIRFSVGKDSPGCGGFIICYKALHAGDATPDVGNRKHICDDLYTEADLTVTGGKAVKT